MYSSFLLFTKTGGTVQALKQSYSKNLLELGYAKKMIDIEDWMNQVFPNMHSAVDWCDNAPKGTPIYAYDPEIIWGNYEGQFRIFLINCTEKIGELATYSSNNPLYVASISRCNPSLPVDDSDGKYALRKSNNEIICSSEEIQPNLYKFTGYRKF